MTAFQQVIRKLLSGASLTGDDFAVMLLIVMMLASLAHLLTMLITRWGDRNTAIKSLLASILIHGVGLLGLEVFEPASIRRERTQALPPEIPDVQTEILVESNQEIPLPESGNMPVADRPTAPDTELARLDVISPEISPLRTPERIPDELESIRTDVRDVTQFEQRELAELAVPTDSGREGPKQAAAEDPDSQLKTAFEKSSTDVFAPQLSRITPESGRPDETQRNADPSAPLAAPELKFELPKKNVAMNLATETDTSILLPPASATADVVERRSAPELATDASDESAEKLTRKNQSSAAMTFQSRLPRPSRTMPDRDPAVRASRSTPNLSQTPTPLSVEYDDVRIGDLAPTFSESLASAAPLKEADLPEIQRRENPPATYQLRNITARRDAALKFGGTRESETAVERSLKWMAMHQSADGRWDASDFGSGQVEFDRETGTNRLFAGREADTGLTALVVLSFLGAGYTHENGRYALTIDHGLEWLIRQQADDGNLYGRAEHYARNYCHAMATYALAEAYGMQQETFLGPILDPELLLFPSDLLELTGNISANLSMNQPLLLAVTTDGSSRRTLAQQRAFRLRRVDDIRLRSALARAVSFTISQQNPETGGWRYKLGDSGDVSMFGWQMMSLKSAEIAGVAVPSDVRKRMETFLQSVRQGEHGGLFGYRAQRLENGQNLEPVTPTMTAEALFCEQMLGFPRETPASTESVSYLMRHAPRLTDLNYYYWYYGTLAMYQYGGRAWEDWNSSVRDVLISLQIPDGPNAGSWDPNDKWGRFGGRLYSTALATLTLEVYYRFLPLYRMNDPADPSP